MTIVSSPFGPASPHRSWRQIALELARTPNRQQVISLIAELTDALDSRPRCSICDQRCDLESCKTDEAGLAVHEDCLVIKLTLKRVSDDNHS